MQNVPPRVRKWHLKLTQFISREALYHFTKEISGEMAGKEKERIEALYIVKIYGNTFHTYLDEFFSYLVINLMPLVEE